METIGKIGGLLTVPSVEALYCFNDEFVSNSLKSVSVISQAIFTTYFD